jgi:hypothetical protein
MRNGCEGAQPRKMNIWHAFCVVRDIFLIPHFWCGTAFHKTGPIIFIYLVSVKELLHSSSCLLRYKFRRSFYNILSFSVFPPVYFWARLITSFSTAVSYIYPSVLFTCIYNTAGRRSQNELGAINRSYFELFCFCDFCVEAQLYNGSCRKYNWEDPAYFYF